MKRPIRNNPATAAGTGGLAVSAFLVAIKAPESVVLAWNALAACGTLAVRYLDLHGGLHGLWQRVWEGKPR